MATILQKMSTKLNEDFRTKIIEAMYEKFKLEVENDFNFINMRLTTFRVDEEPFTQEQNDFLEAFSKGFREAMNLVSAGL